MLGLFLVASVPAWAWGTYGHQQIADEAVEASSGDGGRWLKDSRAAVVRMSISPDCEWKANRGCPLPSDPGLKKLVEEADAYEHPLHFFEPDAFVKGGQVTSASVARLPVGEFSGIVNDYVRLLAANLDYVKRFPHERPIAARPTAIDVAETGTAPWRVDQLALLAVQALRNRKDSLALVYLGTLGHYVGDLSQPLHTTMNYDGQVHQPSAKGIHSAFETAELERRAKHAGAVKDARTKIWSTFRATQTGTRRAARAAAATFASLRSVKDITGALVRMTGDSYAGVAPLLNAYAADQTPEAFAKAKVLGGATVEAYTDTRLGVGAAALAAVWRVVFQEAGRSGRGAMAFDLRSVIENYPKPEYLPREVLDDWSNRGNGRGTATVDTCAEEGGD